jgi:preprotein translocase subunit Sec61beta
MQRSLEAGATAVRIDPQLVMLVVVAAVVALAWWMAAQVLL